MTQRLQKRKHKLAYRAVFVKPNAAWPRSAWTSQDFMSYDSAASDTKHAGLQHSRPGQWRPVEVLS